MFQSMFRSCSFLVSFVPVHYRHRCFRYYGDGGGGGGEEMEVEARPGIYLNIRMFVVFM